jgi:alkanesulfonate monooxygenase SsuD/methylene tetrahydromethanopterin reductase-like flavin-dependent oxidoreductase (luciferase family)
MIAFGITDHVEGPRQRPSEQIYAEMAAQTALAEDLGFEYAWFAEHHAHAHDGHLPAPLLLALYLSGQLRRIRLGTAVVCLNLHHPLAIGEQCAVADLLMEGRGAFGFGSGSTPEEFGLFGLAVTQDAERHERFEAALRQILEGWQSRGGVGGASNAPLPTPRADLASRCWVAVNSVAAADIAGRLRLNILFSHLRTPEQYRQYVAAYRAAGGAGRVAANRPVHVAADDAAAYDRIEPALRGLWRRFQREGKIPADRPEPRAVADLCAHPINFIVGGPRAVAGQLEQLHRDCPHDVANVEVRWPGLSRDATHDCMRLLAEEVRPLLRI